jgi:hypothetical protein
MLRNGFRILAIRWKRLASIFTDHTTGMHHNIPERFDMSSIIELISKFRILGV